MQLKRIGILVLAAAVLAVMTGGMASAMSLTYDYQNPLKSYITSWGSQADQASASWYDGYGTDYEHMDVYKNAADHLYIASTNDFTNSAPHVGTVHLFWNRIARDSNWNSCLTPTLGGTDYSTTLSYGESYPDPGAAGIAEINKNAASQEYYYDEGHNYYPSSYPFSQYAYSANPMAIKIIDLH